MLNRIQKSVDFISNKIKVEPKIALILGTGLGDFAKSVNVILEIPYSEIPNFPATTVDGHAGKLIYAKHKNKDLLIMQGRIHFYEGLPMEAITYPVRVMKYLGIQTLILSNASGGMNENLNIGDLMIINDHINMMPNPLIGKHYPQFGERFPDMSESYSKELISIARQIAKENKIEIHEGVYLSVSGPTYETPAEYKFFRIAGADAVGMSTVPEVIVARQMGIRCFAVSVITDLGIPGKIEYMTHEMVQEAAVQAEPKMSFIVNNLIEKI